MIPKGEHETARTLKLKLATDQTMAEYAYVPFDVPAKTTRINLTYNYPKSDTCIIDLGVGNPDLTDFPSKGGLVGWSGGAQRDIFIATDGASPGYQPGIRTGTWQVILGLYRVPNEPVTVEIEITFDFAPRVAARPAAPSIGPPRGPSWYCGDLHCHTDHSDAKGSAATLHATARREGLDFLAVSDHNTTTAHASYFDHLTSADLVFVPAYEFTTERGHGNVFGAREVEDFRIRNDLDVVDMIGRIRAKGHLFSINRDKPNIPWRYALPEIDCMEVWHAPWPSGNNISLKRYQARLSKGQRITAVGGSDFHQPAVADIRNLATLARPCTFLFCEELSIEGILDALGKGRNFVTESPDGPRLVLNVGDIGHGGEIAGAKTISLAYHATDVAGDILEIWDATGCIATAPIINTQERGVLELTGACGFLRGQIIAGNSRDTFVSAAQAHIAAGKGGRLDWSNALDQPVLRSLTSPIYLV
jgi:predicted metal-dependent phosphoesterase TrpH